MPTLRFGFTHAMNKRLVFLVVIFALTDPHDGSARITKAWRYQEMFDKADLVAIGRVVTSKDSDEHTTLGPFKVIGVVTDFKIHLVIKGSKSVTGLQLHHYRLASDAQNETIANGPNLIKFSWQHSPFLLFLAKERDGKYAPVTGQEDPGIYSVLELRGSAD